MTFPSILHLLPKVRGKISENVPLARYTWLQVGGEAQVLYLPKDEADLALFLAQLPLEVPVHVMGAASNTLIRDGGIPGVTIKFGASFAKIDILPDHQIRAGAALLDNMLAKQAAASNIGGLEFYVGIPGTIGGALRMNAGCYGEETRDVLVEAIALNRRGRRIVLSLEDMHFSYRHCGADPDLIFIGALFQGRFKHASVVFTDMKEIVKDRENSQPIKEKTGGSTFKNPDPKLSRGRGAWEVIDAAGGRGFMIGGAMMSRKHCNFMINQDGATAADLETLGKIIHAKVKANEGVDLEWEIRRVGVK